jgi:hypothetical protein
MPKTPVKSKSKAPAAPEPESAPVTKESIRADVSAPAGTIAPENPSPADADVESILKDAFGKSWDKVSGHDKRTLELSARRLAQLRLAAVGRELGASEQASLNAIGANLVSIGQGLSMDALNTAATGLLNLAVNTLRRSLGV